MNLQDSSALRSLDAMRIPIMTLFGFNDLLGIRDQDTIPFQESLEIAVSRYRSARIEHLIRTRADDKAASRELAKLADDVCALIRKTVAGNAHLRVLIPSVPSVPSVVARHRWMFDLADAVQALAADLEASTSVMGGIEPPFDVLRQFAHLLRHVNVCATMHPLFWLDSVTVEPETLSTLLDPVKRVAQAALLSCDGHSASRGPEKNQALRFFVGEVDDIVGRLRGKALMPNRYHDRDYTGRAQNDDARFLVAIVKLVHGTIPDGIRAKVRLALNDTAVINALKEHCEARNRLADKLPA